MTNKLYNELIEKKYTPVTEVPDNADTVLLYFKNLSSLNRKIYVSNVTKDDQHTFDNQNQTINFNNITNTATFCLKEYVKPEINCDDATDNSVQLEADGTFDLVINGKVVESNKTIKELCDIYNLSSTNDLLILADQANNNNINTNNSSTNNSTKTDTIIDNTCYVCISSDFIEKGEGEITITLQEVITKDTCNFTINLSSENLDGRAKGKAYYIDYSLYNTEKFVIIQLVGFNSTETNNLLTVNMSKDSEYKLHILPNTNTSLKLLNNDKTLSFKMTAKAIEKD